MRARTRVFFAALCLLACAGCGGGSSAGDDDGAAGGGSPAKPAATFTQIYDMIFPRATNAHCDMCHGSPPSVANGNLFMGMGDRAVAYQALVGKMSPMTPRCTPMPLVVPGKPDESLLVQKLIDPPPCGDRMPVGGMALSPDQIDMIRSWIADGAKDN